MQEQDAADKAAVEVEKSAPEPEIVETPEAPKEPEKDKTVPQPLKTKAHPNENQHRNF